LLYKGGFSEGTDANDADLVDRIARSFQSSSDIHEGPSDSFWNSIVAQNKSDVAGYLLTNRLDDAARLLRDPASTNFFYGFEHLVLEFALALERRGEQGIAEQSGLLYSMLTRTAAALGLVRVANPEASAAPSSLSTDELIAAIEESVGTKISFPNPFPREFGLVSTRGVISYRAIQSLYQAIVLKRFAAEFDAPSVIEIGGGLGRAAYYAHVFGLRDYTLIDLPTTGVAQAYFLGRTLGDETISLQGEPARGLNIRIPEWLPSATKVDVVINVDSLTEMARPTADGYVQWAKKNARLLISINHEANPFTAHEVMRDAGLISSREPYWLRDGYVLEVARLQT